MMKHNGHRRPEEIEAQIERTRLELDETLSAIESRLTPGQLVDQGIDYLRHSGAKQYVSNLGASAKNDPLPLALVGVGLAWLMMSDRNGRRHADAGRSVGEAASHVKERVSQTTHKIAETAHAARERAGRIGESARQQAERVRGGYEHLVNEQPLALGAVGLAIGAVLAALAPRTRQEAEWMGDSAAGLDDRKHPERAAAPDLGEQAGPMERTQPLDPMEVASADAFGAEATAQPRTVEVQPGASPLVPPTTAH